MVSNLVIDFVQMPWSKSAASWEYHGEEIWDALQKAVSNDGDSVHVVGEASANDHLSGVLKVARGGFRASVTIEGSGWAPPKTNALSAQGHEGARRYFEDLNVKIAASSNAVTATVNARFPVEEKGRMEFLLHTLWDLQLLSLRILQDA